MSQSLPDTIWSPEDLGELIADLHRYAQWLSSYLVKQHVVGAAAATPPNVSAAAVGYLRSLQSQQLLHGDGLETLIAELEKLKLNAPVVTITLAGPPSNGLKKQVVAWCRQHIEGNILVGFQFNATILGGMVVRHGSHIFDWSFRRQILANRGKFAEVLRNV